MDTFHSKHIDSSKLESLIAVLREKKLNIAFTNGCFDILHPGHIEYLAKAKEKTDCLIVGLNSDDSIKKIKGPKRPINNFMDRLVMLAGLSSVDYIIGFDENTPIKLIQKLRPHLLIKGGDYDEKDIVGAEFVKSLGGKVEIIAFKEGYSTTELINRIKNA